MTVEELATLMSARMDRHDSRLAEIHEQTSATNGRVRKLEMWQAELKGAAKGGRIAWAIAGTLAGALVTVVTIIPHLRNLFIGAQP